jgi:hypothetical protein
LQPQGAERTLTAGPDLVGWGWSCSPEGCDQRAVSVSIRRGRFWQAETVRRADWS